MAERPSSEDISTWQKWFAVACNNRAWELVGDGTLALRDVISSLNSFTQVPRP